MYIYIYRSVSIQIWLAKPLNKLGGGVYGPKDEQKQMSGYIGLQVCKARYPSSTLLPFLFWGLLIKIE